jgi:hypothetical protein
LALASRIREEEEDTKGRLDTIEENWLNINEKRKEKLDQHTSRVIE